MLTPSYAPLEIVSAALRDQVATFGGSVVVDIEVANRGEREGARIRKAHRAAVKGVMGIRAEGRCDLMQPAPRFAIAALQ